MLEQQWQPSTTRFLQVSSTLHYAWSLAAPTGAKVSDLRVDGVPVDPSATYRVSVNRFLAAGGDGFTGFTAGTDVTGGGWTWTVCWPIWPRIRRSRRRRRTGSPCCPDRRSDRGDPASGALSRRGSHANGRERHRVADAAEERHEIVDRGAEEGS